MPTDIVTASSTTLQLTPNSENEELINEKKWLHFDENDNQMISSNGILFNEQKKNDQNQTNFVTKQCEHHIKNRNTEEKSNRLSKQKSAVKTSTTATTKPTTTTTTIETPVSKTTRKPVSTIATATKIPVSTRATTTTTTPVSTTGTRMKKWSSSADVKCSKRDRGVVGQKGQGRGYTIKNSNDISKSTVTNLSHGKSIRKLGPSNSLNISQQSLLRFGLEHRKPSFLCEKGVLQVFVNSRAAHLPVPNSKTDLNINRELDAPESEPTLNWVYGFRGKDCRENLYELPTGEIIYFTGTIVVLHNPNEKFQRYYTKHTSDIKCMAIHPNKLYIATGQTSRRFLEKSSFNSNRLPISSITTFNNILQTDQYKAHIRIWDSITLQTLHTIGTDNANADFDRGVQCCAFSCAASDGMQLAIIDDSYEHILSVWQWQKGKKIAEIKSANDQVFACEFHPLSRNILMSYGKGHCNIWTIDRETFIKKSITFEGRNKPKLILCSHFTESGHIITGDSNGTLAIWDINQVKIIRQVRKAHNGGVWAMCLLKNGHFISAGKDRILFEWKINDLTKIRGPIPFPDEGSGFIRTIISTSSSRLFIGTTRNTIWCGTLDNGFQQIQQGHADAVKFIISHPTKSQFLSSSTDNKLRLYDTKTKTVLWSLPFKDEVCCADFHPNGDIFVVGFTNRTWSVYKYTEQTEVYIFEEENEINVGITAIRFSSVGNFLAVATKEKKLLIYAISGDFRHYVKVSQITELNAPIKVIDWSSDATLLRANDDEFQPYIWNSSTGQPASIQEASEMEWASARCPISFENACISYDLMKSVASIDRSPDQRYVVLALSNGILRFYQYPATTTLASYKEVYGCSTALRNITFVGELLISDGGSDGAIYQWKLSDI